MTQGERVREVRKFFGFTLEKFGEKIGMKKNSVSQIENGKNKVTEANIKAICREFNINEKWLRTGSGNMRIPVEDEATAAVSDLMEKSNPLYDTIKGIMIAYQKLDMESRKIIDQFIEEALSQDNHPQKPTKPSNPALSQLSIEEKVSLYRQELELEEKVGTALKVLPENA